MKLVALLLASACSAQHPHDEGDVLLQATRSALNQASLEVGMSTGLAVPRGGVLKMEGQWEGQCLAEGDHMPSSSWVPMIASDCVYTGKDRKQVWTWDDKARIVNVATWSDGQPYCLDIRHASCEDGAVVGLYKCGSQKWQQWSHDELGRFQSKHCSGKCLDIYSSKKAKLSSCHKGEQQQFAWDGISAVTVTTATTVTPMKPARDTVSASEWEHFRLVKELRERGFCCGENCYKANSKLLEFDCALWRASWKHSKDMADHGYLSHNSQDGRKPEDRASAVGRGDTFSAENVAAGSTMKAARALEYWKEPGSPHCNNMMNPSMRSFAVGHSEVKKGDWWTQMLDFSEENLDQSCISKFLR